MPRFIHKYSNRRLYDTHRGRTITLLDLADVVLAGEHVRVEYRATGEDITTVTLLHALAERLRHYPDDAIAIRIAEGLVATLTGTPELDAGESGDLEKAGVGIA